MADEIQALFCDPPIAIARLGGSTTPLEGCSWQEPPNPRAEGATVLAPDWSLTVRADGSVEETDEPVWDEGRVDRVR